MRAIRRSEGSGDQAIRRAGAHRSSDQAIKPSSKQAISRAARAALPGRSVQQPLQPAHLAAEVRRLALGDELSVVGQTVAGLLATARREESRDMERPHPESGDPGLLPGCEVEDLFA